jgi:GAF domain-containing protein
MSATPDSTLANPDQRIADLERQLAESRAERDEALGERDKAQRKLAERTAERDEALEQQTATAEVLEVINSSPGNLGPVFDAILEKAHTLCGAAHGLLMTRDGDQFRVCAVHGDPGYVEGWWQLGQIQPVEGGILARLMLGERPVHLADAMAEDSYRCVPWIRGLIEAGTARTTLATPLCKDDKLLGVIFVFRKEVRPFSHKQIALLENFAAQAVIAMENARLITETREALEQQTATAEVLQVINSSPGDLVPVFDALLDKALDLCGAAFGNLWTFDGERFRTAALRRVPEAYLEWQLSRETVPPRPGTVLGHIAAGKAFAQIPDAASEDAYMSTDARTLVELGGGRTVVGVPLRKETSLLGAITIFRQEVKPFTEHQIEVLQTSPRKRSSRWRTRGC